MSDMYRELVKIVDTFERTSDVVLRPPDLHDHAEELERLGYVRITGRWNGKVWPRRAGVDYVRMVRGKG